ncbi:MAG: zinc-dependent metalloprotease, partial [Acidimicrobiales bacterium]|nr:zinc-dependent metalloprotease [Acidimicrobiales bacterium]
MAAVDWGLAEKVAIRAAGREPFAESYHYPSLASDFEELTGLAEEQVAAATGLRSASGAARARVTDRQGWVRANIASFQRLLRPLTDRLEQNLSSNPFAPVATRVAG